MKRILALILALMMIFVTFVACDAVNPKETEKPTEKQTETEKVSEKET